MKPKLLPYLITILFTGIIYLSSCDDIIEPSISKKTVQVEAPADSLRSTNYAMSFWWDQVDHALSYHLQVVTPDFKAPGSLVLDTIITKNTFTFTLSPGTYQWRVMAQNGSSQTAYSTPRSFTILASSIKQQAVQLISPGNNAVTGQSSSTFQWVSLYGATKYQFQIDTNNFVSDSLVVLNKVIPGLQLNFTFPKNQVYQWRVRAENDTAQAKWSAVYSVTYDNVPPGQVSLVAPVNGATVSLPVSLQWGAAAGAAKYKLYVYKGDGTTIYNSTFPVTLTDAGYSFNLGLSGDKIYWTVTALDAVGNESKPAAANSFSLQ